MTMSKILKFIAANAFWIVVLINIYVAMQIIMDPENSLAYNKTLGASLDMTKILWWIFMLIPLQTESLPLFAMGYGISYFSKRKLNERLTLMHLLVMAIALFILVPSFYFHKVISIVSWAIFMILLNSTKPAIK